MIKDIYLEEAEQICNSYFKETLKDSGLRSFSFSGHAKAKALYVEREEKRTPVAILIYRELTDEVKEIDYIATRADFKRTGAAQRLLQSLKGPELWLELKEGNLSALSFYKKNGFIQVGRREGYYEGGGAALNMLKKRTL